MYPWATEHGARMPPSFLSQAHHIIGEGYLKFLNLKIHFSLKHFPKPSISSGIWLDLPPFWLQALLLEIRCFPMAANIKILTNPSPQPLAFFLRSRAVSALAYCTCTRGFVTAISNSSEKQNHLTLSFSLSLSQLMYIQILKNIWV